MNMNIGYMCYTENREKYWSNHNEKFELLISVFRN